ncbi:NADP-dependent oxidoreductase [Streptomyces uncialis]|uniref:NADP-dependent oxidoreductase n=1 Tax=Streptomyces uncialis TaxID=1048205 RepID=UPI002E2EC43E|nr:NADP-dependent oxidoreductase [Streptomyces uncialis]
MPKAFVFTRHGGPEAQALVDRAKPVPGPGELLVAVRAAGVNPVDWKLREGLRRPGAGEPRFPVVLGSEVAGTVEALGPDVSGFQVGDAVFGNPSDGGYAEYTLLPVALAARKPDAVSFTDAAALPVAAATALDGVRQLALPRGATLLVTGAGGGVGASALQLAVASGLRVVGLASAGKKEFVESLGAVHVASGPGFAARVGAVTPDGVDGVLDLVGGEVLQEAGPLVADRTKLVSAGDREGVTRLGGAFVVRARAADVLGELAARVADGSLDPRVTRVVPLDRAAEALREVEEGHARGKTVIEIGGGDPGGDPGGHPGGHVGRDPDGHSGGRPGGHSGGDRDGRPGGEARR